MTFLREIWDKKAAKREVEVTTRKEYEEKVSRKGSCRKGDKINIVIDADHPDTVIEFSKRYLQRSGYVLRILLPCRKRLRKILSGEKKR